MCSGEVNGQLDELTIQTDRKKELTILDKAIFTHQEHVKLLLTFLHSETIKETVLMM